MSALDAQAQAARDEAVAKMMEALEPFARAFKS